MSTPLSTTSEDVRQRCPLLTYQQAASLLGVPRGTLYAWVHEGRIPHIRLSRRTVRFDEGELLAWIEQHRVTTGHGAAAAREVLRG